MKGIAPSAGSGLAGHPPLLTKRSIATPRFKNVRGGREQEWRQDKKERVVVGVEHFPAAGGVRRDDIDVAVDGGAAIVFAIAAASETGGRADVQA